jgi:hypothetical protein
VNELKAGADDELGGTNSGAEEFIFGTKLLAPTFNSLPAGLNTLAVIFMDLNRKLVNFYVKMKRLNFDLHFPHQVPNCMAIHHGSDKYLIKNGNSQEKWWDENSKGIIVFFLKKMAAQKHTLSHENLVAQNKYLRRAAWCCILGTVVLVLNI